MSDTTETPEAVAQIQAFAKEIDTIVKIGREDYGDEAFDNYSHEVAEAAGKENVLQMMESIAQFDATSRLIEHLANNPAEAKKIATMSAARRMTHLARIEAQLLPSGANTGAEPAWKVRARGGEKRGLGDDVPDKQWSKNFDRKYGAGGIPGRGNRG